MALRSASWMGLSGVARPEQPARQQPAFVAFAATAVASPWRCSCSFAPSSCPSTTISADPAALSASCCSLSVARLPGLPGLPGAAEAASAAGAAWAASAARAAGAAQAGGHALDLAALVRVGLAWLLGLAQLLGLARLLGLAWLRG